MKKLWMVLALALGAALGAGVDHVREAAAAQAYQRTVMSSTYFAPTTSAQLAGVLSDETGTGLAVFGTSPTLGGTVAGTASFVGTSFRSGTAGNSPGNASFYSNAVTGATLQAIAGSSYDFSIINPGNALYIARNPTGTQNLEVLGRVQSRSREIVEVLCASAVAVVTPATTAESVLYTCTIPAAAIGPNGTVRVSATWTYSNNANTKALRVRLGGIGGTAIYGNTFTAELATTATLTFQNRNSQSSQFVTPIVQQVNSSATLVSIASSTAAIDTSSAQTLVFTCAKVTSSGDTCTLERVLVELAYGA